MFNVGVKPIQRLIALANGVNPPGLFNKSKGAERGLGAMPI